MVGEKGWLGRMKEEVGSVGKDVELIVENVGDDVRLFWEDVRMIWDHAVLGSVLLE